MRAVVVLFLAGSMGLIRPAQAQQVASPFATVRAPTYFAGHELGRADVASRADMARAAEGKNHTLTGILIGGVLGMAAGWVVYDGLCEAVDNSCNGSRVPLVMRGGVVGAAIGGLIGSLAD